MTKAPEDAPALLFFGGITTKYVLASDGVTTNYTN